MAKDTNNAKSMKWKHTPQVVAQEGGQLVEEGGMQGQKDSQGPDDLMPLTHSKDFSFFTEWDFEQSDDMIRLKV